MKLGSASKKIKTVKQRQKYSLRVEQLFAIEKKTYKLSFAFINCQMGRNKKMKRKTEHNVREERKVMKNNKEIERITL